MKLNAVAFSLLVELLMEGDYTAPELIEETGLHYLTVYEYLKAMRKRGLLHIVRWDNDSYGRCSLRVYKLGRGKDASKPTISKSEKCRRYRQRRKEAALLGILVARENMSKPTNAPALGLTP